MGRYRFTVMAVEESKRPESSEYGFTFQMEIEAATEEEARKLGISEFLKSNPDENINDFITDISSGPCVST